MPSEERVSFQMRISPRDKERIRAAAKYDGNVGMSAFGKAAIIERVREVEREMRRDQRETVNA